MLPRTWTSVWLTFAVALISLLAQPAPGFAQLPADPLAHIKHLGFGQGLAAAGDMVVVGATGVNDKRGAAYVYKLSKGEWKHTATLTCKDSKQDRYGAEIATDGKNVLIGHDDESFGFFTKVGAAYLYRDPVVGRHDRPLRFAAREPPRLRGFGERVAMRDGCCAVSSTNAFAVTPFRHTKDKWLISTEVSTANLERKPDWGEMDLYGGLAFAGESLVAGGWLSEPGRRTGAVYVFDPDKDGRYVAPAKVLTAGDAPGIKNLGYTVTASRDLIVAGAAGTPFDGREFVGAVLVYERDKEGMFPQTPTAVLTPSRKAADGFFGTSLALFDRHIVVGASGGSGLIYVFEAKQENGRSIWTEAAILNDKNEFPRVGGRIAATAGHLFVTDSGPDPVNSTGQVHIFTPEGGDVRKWRRTGELVMPK